MTQRIPSKIHSAVRLHIIIVGAGIGGLSTAYALCRKGHEVTVFETTEKLMTAGAGIQIPPVSTRILRRWNLADEFVNDVTVPRTFAYFNYCTGERIGAIPLNPESEEWYGSPWWTMHRADYQRILYNAACSSGAKVLFGCPVQSVDCSKPSVSVLQDGEKRVYEADLVVGADGLRSKVREEMFGDDAPAVKPSSVCAYRALVPLRDMKSDPLLEHLMEPRKVEVEVWLGPEHATLAYPVRQGPQALYNLVLLHPQKDSHTQNNLPERFPRPASISDIAAHYANFGPQIRNLVSVLIPEGESEHIMSQLGLSAKDGILEWRLGDLPRLETYLAPSKKVVLISDASHAQYPYLSAGAAMAVEDGAALAECLSPLRLKQHDLPVLLQLFQKVRKPRNDRMQSASAADGPLWNLPEGPKQQRRDELLQALGSKDRKACADAMNQLKVEGIGQFDFGDPVFMDWAWGYDVVKDINESLDALSSTKTSSE